MTDIGVSWPGGFAHLVRNAVAIEKLDQLAVEAHTLADCPNFWMPKVKLVQFSLLDSSTDTFSLYVQEALSQLARTTAEAVVASLYNSVVSAKLSQQCSGAEWWVQVLSIHTEYSFVTDSVFLASACCHAWKLPASDPSAPRDVMTHTCTLHLNLLCHSTFTVSMDMIVQVYQPGKGLAFHFDKDEHAMKERSEMVQPILSSVLYLTGDTSTDRIGKQTPLLTISNKQNTLDALLHCLASFT